MQYFSFSVFADLCQASTIFLSLIAYLPQWSTILKRRSSEHVALWAWILWLGSSGLSLVYAFLLNYLEETARLLLITSTFNVCFLLFTLALILRFRKPVVSTSNE